jgi:type IV secretory pathway TraG/TraD family ATPase VirD4
LGKSKSILNPLIRSALDQRITTTVFDFKYPEQTKEIAGYAAQRGYKVQIIAPSYVESGILNILDFIKDSGDSLGSGQISEVLTENTSKAKDR